MIGRGSACSISERWKDWVVWWSGCGEDCPDHGAYQQYRQSSWFGNYDIKITFVEEKTMLYVMSGLIMLLLIGGFSVFAGVGERTREGNDLYKEMIESGVIKLGEKQVVLK
jgi:hypothetical protein